MCLVFIWELKRFRAGGGPNHKRSRGPRMIVLRVETLEISGDIQPWQQSTPRLRVESLRVRRYSVGEQIRPRSCETHQNTNMNKRTRQPWEESSNVRTHLLWEICCWRAGPTLAGPTLATLESLRGLKSGRVFLWWGPWRAVRTSRQCGVISSSVGQTRRFRGRGLPLYPSLFAQARLLFSRTGHIWNGA